MKIELKQIKFSEAMSEETNAFTANLYINGRKVGYCKNTGQGGCTDYNSDSPALRPIIAEAETYCKALPNIDYGDFNIKNNLEHVIDQCLEAWLEAKEAKKFERKMLKAIMVGIPKAGQYGIYNFKIPLSAIPLTQLQASIERIKAKLEPNEIILNTNLSELGVQD